MVLAPGLSGFELSGFWLPGAAAPGPYIYDSLTRERHIAADLTQTPYFLGNLSLSTDAAMDIDGLRLTLTPAGDLSVIPDGTVASPAVTLLGDWAAAATPPVLANPAIDFMVGEVRYRFVVDSTAVQLLPDKPELGRHVTYLDGHLFRSTPEAPKPRP